MCSDTLFLAVAFVDRYLSLRSVPRSQLQLVRGLWERTGWACRCVAVLSHMLCRRSAAWRPPFWHTTVAVIIPLFFLCLQVGVACMWVASKYEEIYPPSVDDYAYITDHTYSRTQLANAERDVLATLSFDLTQPTAKTFLRRYVKAAAAELDLTYTFEHLTAYLLELTLLDYSCLGYLPSMVAASTVLLALYTLDYRPWTATLSRYTGYSPRSLRHCAQVRVIALRFWQGGSVFGPIPTWLIRLLIMPNPTAATTGDQRAGTGVPHLPASCHPGKVCILPPAPSFSNCHA